MVVYPIRLWIQNLHHDRHNYERGTFEHSEPLLRAAEHYCLSHDGCELILADIYGARASVATETNQPSSARDNFTLQYESVDRAVKHGMVDLPDIRYCFGVGGMGNGAHGMGQYEDAERWYRKCFEAFEGLDADKRIYVSAVVLSRTFHYARYSTLLMVGLGRQSGLLLDLAGQARQSPGAHRPYHQQRSRRGVQVSEPETPGPPPPSQIRCERKRAALTRVGPGTSCTR